MSTQRFIETVQRIDFSAVGATDLLPLDIKDAVVKEKLSVMLYDKYFLGNTLKPNLKYSEFIHPNTIGEGPLKRTLHFTAKRKDLDEGPTGSQTKERHYLFSVSAHPPCINFKEPKAKGNNFEYFAEDPRFIPIKSGAKLENISIFDSMRKLMPYSDSLRIEELSKITCPGSASHTYAPFKISSMFSPQQFPDTLPSAPNALANDFYAFQRRLDRWSSTAFPRFYKRSIWMSRPNKGNPNVLDWELKPVTDNTDHVPVNLPFPIFYAPFGPMVYEIPDDKETLAVTRFYRLFFNNGCGLREALIPVCMIKGDGYQNAIMTGLPNRDRLALWNLKRILSSDTETVVLCGCIQDAEALQRNNDFESVAFTSYVDVGDNLELVDFIPLAEKNVVFFISNHNGGTLEDAYEEAAGVFEFIRKKGIKIKDCEFVQREVQYPCNTMTIATPEDLNLTYLNFRPKIVPESSLIMDETDFFTFLAKIRKKRETPPFWAPAESEPVKENPAKGILIRSLLYRNAITVIAGPPAAGKSRFCRSLIRYLVNGNDRRYMKERFWTRCCKKSPMKILYWNFDCIPDLEAWKKICLRGLNEEQRENIFIENAPTETEGFCNMAYGMPDVGAYKRKLVKYTNKGILGHPVDLLIVDTLVSVWNKKNIEGSLHFLNQLIKAVPGMAVLAIHHTTELGKPLGGGDPKRMPRIVMTMERINQRVKLDSSGNPSPKKKKGEKKTATYLYRFRYDKFSTSHADVEDLPFYCVREDEDMYSVYEPVCSRDEMFGSLVYHYRENDDAHPSNKVIGAMLGYSNREVQKRAIDEKKYLSILNRAEKKAKKNDESLSES